MAEATSGAKTKTDRKLLVWVAVMVMVALVLYLFLAKGADLGQSKVNAVHAAQEKKAQAKRYEDRITDPDASSKDQLADAKRRLDSANAAKKQAAQAKRAAHARPVPPPPMNIAQLAPPPDMNDAGITQMDHANAVVNHPGNGQGEDATTPSFVMFEAGAKTKGHHVGADSLKLHASKGKDDTQLSPDDADKIADPNLKAAYKRLAAAQKRQGTVNTLLDAKADQTQTPGSEGNEQWLYRAQNRHVKVSTPIVATRNKALYWLAPGTIVHAVIENAINTRLPGQIAARVTQTVYDSRYGRYEVIPAGSILKGTYNTSIKDGQERALVAFDTLVTPSGGVLDLGSLSAGDALGRAGVKGTLHTHFWKRMGIAGLFAVEAIGADRLSSRRQVVTANGTTGTPAESSAGRILSKAANDELKRRNDLTPNITLPAGSLTTLTLARGVEIPPVANTR